MSGTSTGGGVVSVGGGVKLDVGGGDTGEGFGDEGGGGAGCEKVDFLFVIDSSNSMETNQGALVASFPEFVSGIQSALDGVSSYHVGVVTSDAYAFNADGCTQIGALVTQTGGKDSSDETCGPFAQGHRFMTQADDLPEAFACTALVGTGGENDEAMMDAAIAALDPQLNASGACNEGFIRPDALLVMVLITDEDDPGTCVNGGQDCSGSAGDPQSWFDDVVVIKQHPDNAVVLSLTRGAPDNMCGSPQGTEKDGDRIIEFVEQFGSTGLRGDVCADSFGSFFAAAIGVVETACNGFIEPEK